MVSSEKELHFGNSLWAAHSSKALPAEVIRKDLQTDVVIIGAGISGAMMAEELTDARFRVVILDKRNPGHGSTIATTALIQFEIDQPLCRLAPMIGFEKAARAWRRSKLCIDALAVRIRILGIRCGLQPRQSLYLNGNLLNVKELAREMDIRKQVGFQPELLPRKSLVKNYGINAAAALRTLDSYSAHPYHMSQGFLKKALERGARLYSPVNVKAIETSPRRVYIQTSYGFSITARYAVFATGYEVPHQLADQSFKITSTWALATKRQVVQGIQKLPLIWQASDPYFYLRTTSNGRIICGGEDEPFGNEEKRNALNNTKITRLQQKLVKLLPDYDPVTEYAWSGTFGKTATGLPLIGPIPGLNNCFAVMAFGGNGITWSRLGAEMVRNLISGKQETDEDLFRFRTK